MKKFLILSALALMLTSLVTGCKSDEPDPNKDTNAVKVIGLPPGSTPPPDAPRAMGAFDGVPGGPGGMKGKKGGPATGR